MAISAFSWQHSLLDEDNDLMTCCRDSEVTTLQILVRGRLSAATFVYTLPDTPVLIRRNIQDSWISGKSRSWFRSQFSGRRKMRSRLTFESMNSQSFHLLALSPILVGECLNLEFYARGGTLWSTKRLPTRLVK